MKIKTFNFEFESKALNRSSRFVHPDYLEYFQNKSIEIVKNVSILEATTLELKFLKDDEPVLNTSSFFDVDFNKAELTLRYQLSILPSTKLKTILVKQEWVKYQGAWYVIPDLDKFVN